MGDFGTCEDNGSVMTRLSAYSWVGVIPGGLHTKWDLVEACFKSKGQVFFVILLIINEKTKIEY